MLNDAKLRTILQRLPRLSMLVVGDFFLDRYLDIDHRLTETSLETGLDAYQVKSVRAIPGAAGTVTNNLAALGVGHIVALTVIGVDGEGFELKRELSQRRVDITQLMETGERRTPTYTKPMLSADSGPPRELSRLDIKNRRPMPGECVRELLERLESAAERADAVVVADQVSEAECGVITRAVRERLAELARRYPTKSFLADSRAHIGEFRSVTVKPNRSECLRAVAPECDGDVGCDEFESAVRALAARVDGDVYCTCGEDGIVWVRGDRIERVPAYGTTGPIDIVGAGDATTAGIVSALCAGAAPAEAAQFGNLVASITIRQLGTTGTASPEQVISRWEELRTADSRPRQI